MAVGVENSGRLRRHLWISFMRRVLALKQAAVCLWAEHSVIHIPQSHSAGLASLFEARGAPR